VNYREENVGFHYPNCPFCAITIAGVFTQKCWRTSSASLELFFRTAIYALPHCHLPSSTLLKKVDSTLRVILQQSGRNATSIKPLIFSNLTKPSKFAIFSSAVSLFHFKGSISVKKLACFLHFCHKVPILDKNQEQINCSKWRISFLCPKMIHCSCRYNNLAYFQILSEA
jgi:hypothetical protein